MTFPMWRKSCACAQKWPKGLKIERCQGCGKSTPLERIHHFRCERAPPEAVRSPWVLPYREGERAASVHRSGTCSSTASLPMVLTCRTCAQKWTTCVHDEICKVEKVVCRCTNMAHRAQHREVPRLWNVDTPRTKPSLLLRTGPVRGREITLGCSPIERVKVLYLCTTYVIICVNLRESV